MTTVVINPVAAWASLARRLLELLISAVERWRDSGPAQQDVHGQGNRCACIIPSMPIDFFNLLDDQRWDPLPEGQADPKDLWNDGGVLADAPVDIRATFDGAMWVTDKMDPSFRMKGFRCRSNFKMPRRHHNQHKLIIVFGGEWNVEYQNDKGKNDKGKKVSEKVIGPGGFFVVDEGTPHTLIAGPDGVTYTEQWDYHPTSDIESTWYEEGWVRR